jgi:MYXO-CTERM domain-containing protein
MRKTGLLLSCSVAALAVALSGAAAHAGSVRVYDWEGGLDGWTAANATLANSTTLGVTHGSSSLLLDDLTGGFKNDAGVSTVGTGPAFNAWNQAGTRLFAGDTDVKLEFDFSYDHTNATNLPQFGQLALFLNSTSVGFTQYGTGQLIGGNLGQDFPRLDSAAVTDGVTLTSLGPNTVHIAIPLGVRVGVGPGTFYQIGFKANGSWGGTVDWAIDNMQITGANIVPEPASATLAGLLGIGLIAGLRRRS